MAELKRKVTLKKKGDATEITLKKKDGAASTVHAKLTWKKAVDLDLHVFYKTKDGKFGHVYFANKGQLDKAPYIALDQDAGVGNTAGDASYERILREIGPTHHPDPRTTGLPFFLPGGACR